MKKPIKISIVMISITVLILITIFCWFIFNKDNKSNISTETNNTKIVGYVSAVNYRENRAEDGYYGITVSGDNGKEYKINATGYMNTPLTSEEQGEKCVEIPNHLKVKNGQRVEFKLPEGGNGLGFKICYENSLLSKDYFFNVIN